MNLNVKVDSESPLVRSALAILARRLSERAHVELVQEERPPGLILQVDDTLPSDSYRIVRDGESVTICGGNDAGVLYGAGRFLRESVIGGGLFTPCDSVPVSVPDCRIRGMYFAHNFHNWYRSAPLEELVRYVEDLALWGLNHIALPCGTNPQCSQREIEEEMIPRQLELMRAARKLGIRVGLITVANTLHEAPDPGVTATPVRDATPARRGQKGHRVCPGTPGGMALLRERFRGSLEAYADVGLDFVINFPYDEGGCGCERCAPWGANGYVATCREFSRLARARYPDCRFITGTWCFDVLDEPEGEFDGLDRALREDPSWCNATMVDSHHDFPSWPLSHGTPGGLPMVNFPEISMWGRIPWLGSGANPFPERLVRIFGEASHLLDGGFPYSEGCGEDLNKIACLSLYWDKETNAQEIAAAYCRAYFGHAVVDDFVHMTQLMETIYPTNAFDPGVAREVAALADRIAARLPEDLRTSWRWRLFEMRGEIDQLTAETPESGELSPRQREVYTELTRLYHMENSPPSVMKTRGL
ncbi:MAG: hypothetical protein ACO3N7_11895 [Kiritimatiellia bacterium]